MIRTGGQLVVDQFLAQGVRRIFCVPGESYLAVLDALYDVADRIDLISCRHESGATMMAAATGQLNGTPGVAFVTRGPGATNASIAVHIALQGSIPLVLGVGQVARRNIGRGSFQEVDFEAFFGPISKHVKQVNDPAAIPSAIAEAFTIATTGRMGPVVLAFPEDVLSTTVEPNPATSQVLESTTIDIDVITEIDRYLNESKRPLIIVGGGHWTEGARSQLHQFAGNRHIPVCAAWRRLDIFDHNHPCYAGFLGFSTPMALWKRVEQSDCLLVIGARLDEPTTRDYQVPNAADKGQILIHIHPDQAQLGLNFVPDLAVGARPEDVMGSLNDLSTKLNAGWNKWCESARADHLESEVPPVAEGVLDLGAVMAILNEMIPADAIVTVDAGNFTVWPQCHRRYTRPGRFLAPINGAMGYGVPSAIAASLAHPDRVVIGCVGDGGMLMTGMELASAVKYSAKPIILVFNNAKYGTIEMHQQREYPEREIGNDLLNPDFAEFARSFGAFGIQVASTSEFAPALNQALAADTVAVIELHMDAISGKPT
jgi:acetolactate synthase-1/2/3 large subunit